MFVGAMVAFGIWSIGLGNSADAQNGHEHDHSDLVHHDNFTPPGNREDWPPRPVGAGPLKQANPIAAAAIGGPNDPNPRALDAIGATAIVDVAPEAVGNPELLAALGDDFTLISHAEGQVGKYDSIGERWTWFSRSLNQTVIAELKDDGSFAIDILAIDEMQPILSRPERNWAAEIGMDWLLNNGFPEAAGLEGTAIRALDEGKFHDVRMAYVTFATDNFADPTHSVLVDLTNLVAVSGRSL